MTNTFASIQRTAASLLASLFVSVVLISAATPIIPIA